MINAALSSMGKPTLIPAPQPVAVVPESASYGRGGARCRPARRSARACAEGGRAPRCRRARTCCSVADVPRNGRAFAGRVMSFDDRVLRAKYPQGVQLTEAAFPDFSP